MKIVAMINWYDESVISMLQVMDDLQKIDVDTIVSVEGRYENFPDDPHYPRGVSAGYMAERAAIDGTDLLAYSTQEPWKGDEVAKRQFMLDCALSITTDDDWLVVWDADFRLWSIDEDFDVRTYLSALNHHSDESLACDVNFSAAHIPTLEPEAGWHPLRMFMRAVRGMRMGPNHYTYVLPDGRSSDILIRDSTVKADDMTALWIHHQHVLRDEKRHAQQTAYYEVRDGQRLETPGI
jgi:hypothetical protein